MDAARADVGASEKSGGSLQRIVGSLQRSGEAYNDVLRQYKPELDAAFQKPIIDQGCPWDAKRSTLIFPEKK